MKTPVLLGLMIVVLSLSACERLSNDSEDAENQNAADIKILEERLSEVDEKNIKQHEDLNKVISSQKICLSKVVELINLENNINASKEELLPLDKKWNDRNIEPSEKDRRKMLMEAIAKDGVTLKSLRLDLGDSCSQTNADQSGARRPERGTE